MVKQALSCIVSLQVAEPIEDAKWGHFEQSPLFLGEFKQRLPNKRKNVLKLDQGLSEIPVDSVTLYLPSITLPC